MNLLSASLPRSPAAVAYARRLVSEHTGSLAPERQADAALMVSELVTNALVHGTGTVSLRIDAEDDALRVEVADEGQVAVAPSPTPGAHGGWGLRIVESIAEDWGVDAGSTRVWFRIARPRPAR